MVATATETVMIMRGIKKQHLPTKVCPVCQRPFSWRKKWEKQWENVMYCSDACRRRRAAAAGKL
jgi:hypothetical protein